VRVYCVYVRVYVYATVHVCMYVCMYVCVCLCVEVLGQSNAKDGVTVTGNKTNRTRVSLRGLYL